MVSSLREQIKQSYFWLKFTKYFVVIISFAIVALIGMETGIVNDSLIQKDYKTLAAVDGLGITFDEGYQQTIHYTVFNDHGSSFDQGDIPAHLSIFHCKTQGLDSCAPNLTPGDFVRAIKDQAPITVHIPERGGQLNDFVSAETVNCGRVQIDIGLISPGNPKILGGKVYTLGKNCEEPQPSKQPSPHPSVEPTMHPSPEPSIAPSMAPSPKPSADLSCPVNSACCSNPLKACTSDGLDTKGECPEPFKWCYAGRCVHRDFNPNTNSCISGGIQSPTPLPSPALNCPVNSACCSSPVKACTSDGLDVKGECSEPFKWCYAGRCVHRDFNPNTNSCVTGGVPSPSPSASPLMVSCVSLVPNQTTIKQVGDTFTVTTNISPANSGWTKAEIWLFTAANQQPTNNIGWYKLGETTPGNTTLSYTTNATDLILEGSHVIGMKIFNDNDVVNWGTDPACRSSINIFAKQSPTPQVTPSPSVKASPSVSPSVAASPSINPLPSVSPSLDPSVSPSVSPSVPVGGAVNCPNGTVATVKDSVIVCVTQTQSQTQENNQIINLQIPSTPPTHVVTQTFPGHVKGATTMKELPRTGVQAFVVVAGGFLLLGFRLRRFGSGSNKPDLEHDPHYMVEEKKYKKIH